MFSMHYNDLLSLRHKQQQIWTWNSDRKLRSMKEDMWVENGSGWRLQAADYWPDVHQPASRPMETGDAFLEQSYRWRPAIAAFPPKSIKPDGISAPDETDLPHLSAAVKAKHQKYGLVVNERHNGWAALSLDELKESGSVSMMDYSFAPRITGKSLRKNDHHWFNVRLIRNNPSFCFQLSS